MVNSLVSWLVGLSMHSCLVPVSCVRLSAYLLGFLSSAVVSWSLLFSPGCVLLCVLCVFACLFFFACLFSSSALWCVWCSTSLPGGNQVDGLPPAPVEVAFHLDLGNQNPLEWFK